MISIALGIAFVVPLAFLYFIRRFDLYDTGRYWFNLATLLWGVVAYLLAARINSSIIHFGWASRSQVIQLGAPLIEETLKSLILIYLVQRADFNFVVDGAVYGFGAGIGFAISENIEYVTGHAAVALAIAIGRVFSTNLVHATGSGVIGTALAARRGDPSWKSWVFILLGYTFSMSFHIVFNTLVSAGVLLLIAFGFGFVGVGIIWFAIRRGLNVQRAWVGEKLTEADRGTRSETQALTHIEDLKREILSPVEKRFGSAKAELVQKMLLKQAEIGIKRQLIESTPSESKRHEIDHLITEIRDEVKALRDTIGPYCMLLVRQVYLEQDAKVWDAIGSRIAATATGQVGGGLWQRASERIQPSKGPEKLE